jgi:hypothetical protein
MNISSLAVIIHDTNIPYLLKNVKSLKIKRRFEISKRLLYKIKNIEISCFLIHYLF